MPLPNDPTLVGLSEDLIAGFQAAFGKHPGYRPAHARGLLVNGTFTPTADAKALSNAPHFSAESTPVTARFSSSTGIPDIPDTDPNANPRGFAIRFDLGPHKHTDIIAHSTPFFPARTGQDFLEFLNALLSSGPDAPHPSPIEQYLGSHPPAFAFVTAPKPAPTSFSKEAYYGVTALKFVSAAGKETFFRYQIKPDAGEENVAAEELKAKEQNFLFDELPKALDSGPISFSVLAQIAKEGDVVDDATVHWPESRELVKLGTVKLNKLAANQGEAKNIIYDPIPRIQGLEPSADPLLELRAAVYLISGKQRRAA